MLETRLVTDDDLIAAMFGRDKFLAQVAKRIYDKRHENDPQPIGPSHCGECFEGCPKCKPDEFAPRNPAEIPWKREAGVTRKRMEWKDRGFDK